MTSEKKLEPKKSKGGFSFANFKPKNIKRNLEIVRNSPLASLRFRYTATRGLMVFIGGFLLYQIIKLITSFNGRSSLATKITSVAMLVVFVIIVSRMYAELKHLKKTIKQYQEYPMLTDRVDNKMYSKSDIDREIDDILAKYKEDEESRKKKGGTNDKNGTI
jgi:hypothetical protein